MRLIVPATPDGLHPSTIPAILRSGWTPAVVPMLGVDSYWQLLNDIWHARHDLTIVEHDVEVAPGTIQSFVDCPEWWCACSYEVYAGDLATAYGGPYGLGCVRFRIELMEAAPDAVELAGAMDIHPVHPPRSYAVMDSTLTQVLRSISSSARDDAQCFRVHQHYPNVVHHHHYNREGAYRP